MPISYVIDRDQQVLLETWTGNVTAQDLGEFWQEYLANPEVLAVRRTVADLRQCELKFTGEQLASVIANIVEPALQGRQWKSAIVVENPVQFGVSRQYSAFAQRYSLDAIFSDPDAAIRWLLSE